MGDSHKRPLIICQEMGVLAAGKKLTHSNYVESGNRIHNSRYEYIGQYIDYKTKIKIKCLKHGIFEQQPKVHLEGHGCPECAHFSRVSDAEIKWLDSLMVADLKRQYKIQLNEKKYVLVDGYDPMTNTVYEYHGKYWHGHPDIANPDDKHPAGGTYGDRYLDTLIREIRLKELGYNVVSTWK